MTKDSKTLRESEILLRMDIATILAAHKVAPHPESKPIQEILPDLLERITRYKDACIESEIALAKKEAYEEVIEEATGELQCIDQGMIGEHLRQYLRHKFLSESPKEV